MATDGGDTEATDPADVPLTEEDVLAFFHSKSGEVRNSELVSHFRRALKTGQHRATNRQHFPRFVNSLATVRHDDSGRKILTLKKKFRRQEDADVVADRGTASTNVAEAAKCTSLDNDNNNEEETSSKAREAEIGPDDGNRNGNGEREQSAVEEVSASKNDNGEREEEIPASTGQEAAEREDTPAGSGVEKAQPASVSENDVDDDGVGVPETSSAEDGKKSSLDNGDVEETQQANDRTETDVFDNAGGVESLK